MEREEELLEIAEAFKGLLYGEAFQMGMDGTWNRGLYVLRRSNL